MRATVLVEGPGCARGTSNSTYLKFLRAAAPGPPPCWFGSSARARGRTSRDGAPQGAMARESWGEAPQPMHRPMRRGTGLPGWGLWSRAGLGTAMSIRPGTGHWGHTLRRANTGSAVTTVPRTLLSCPRHSFWCSPGPVSRVLGCVFQAAAEFPDWQLSSPLKRGHCGHGLKLHVPRAHRCG